MSSRGETSNKGGQAESSLMLRAMQQQFECMDVMFNEIQIGRASCRERV